LYKHRLFSGLKFRKVLSKKEPENPATLENLLRDMPSDLGVTRIVPVLLKKNVCKLLRDMNAPHA
jgi:hypothetical protein